MIRPLHGDVNATWNSEFSCCQCFGYLCGCNYLDGSQSLPSALEARSGFRLANFAQYRIVVPFCFDLQRNSNYCVRNRLEFEGGYYVVYRSLDGGGIGLPVSCDYSECIGASACRIGRPSGFDLLRRGAACWRSLHLLDCMSKDLGFIEWQVAAPACSPKKATPPAPRPLVLKVGHAYLAAIHSSSQTTLTGMPSFNKKISAQRPSRPVSGRYPKFRLFMNSRGETRPSSFKSANLKGKS